MSLTSATIDRTRLAALIRREQAAFAERNPRSKALFAEARTTLLGGVPMSWMSMWVGGFPLFFEQARGSTLTDVDRHTYVDLCMGDTGAMAGHAPEAVAEAVASRYRRGGTAMLPTADAAWVARELGRRFGLEVWQFSLTATDANRWVLRLARQLTGRPKVLVFNHCYHGTVDEAVIALDERGRPRGWTLAAALLGVAALLAAVTGGCWPAGTIPWRPSPPPPPWRPRQPPHPAPAVRRCRPPARRRHRARPAAPPREPPPALPRPRRRRPACWSRHRR